MKGILLFILAFILTVFFTALMIPLSITYHIITLKLIKGFDRIDKYFHQMALSLDQFANVSLQSVFNLIMIKSDNRRTFLGRQKKVVKSTFDNDDKWIYQYYDKYNFYPFGDEDDTMSYVFAKNHDNNALNSFGTFWAMFLNIVDKDHLQKAIESKKRRDLEAFNRVKDQYNLDIDIDTLELAN